MLRAFVSDRQGRSGRRASLRRALASLLLLVAPATFAAAEDPATVLGAPRVLDDGSDASPWTAIASPSAKARIVPVDDAVELHFDLGRGRAHAIARRGLGVELPPDYMFVFELSGEGEANTIEIKLVSGENVWWRRLVDFEPPREKKEVRIAKPRLAFAWGPAGGGFPERIDSVEIAVVAGKGGKGRVRIDEIRLEPRDGEALKKAPTAEVSSVAADAAKLVDGDAKTEWRSEAADRAVTVTLDFHQSVEHGGLAVEFVEGAHARAYLVEASRDGSKWTEIRRFTRSNGGRDDIFMPDLFARYLRLRFTTAPGSVVGVRELVPLAYEVSASPNDFATSIARRALAGRYPRYFLGEQSYWAVVGAAGGRHEALVNEEGSVEVDAGAFTLEPFLLVDGKLRSWKEGTSSVALVDGELPIPVVTRRDGDITLEVTLFAAGEGDDASLLIRYRLSASSARKLELAVALRPYQVLPPWQALNRTGGVSTIARIGREGDTIRADARRVIALSPPDGFGAAAFEEGDITSFLEEGRLPPSKAVIDDFGMASAALSWKLDARAGQSRDFWLAVPWPDSRGVAAGTKPDLLESLLQSETERWRKLLHRADLVFPAAAGDWSASLRSNLAWILINRDGPAIQPGSRTYERSWIRDGAMTSQALLELGFDAEVKAFLRWYAGYIGADGWVPCCVDARGADPVPEHDSFGEFLWGVAEVWRFTRDESFVREMWPKAQLAALCMSRLRASRMLPKYEGRPERGLLPESISHEGYSARPVHAYWDQAFALRGFADAALLASIVGDATSETRFRAEKEDLEASLRRSIALVMQQKGLDVVPASVELGDFDPTSTALSFLLGSDELYPRDALERSFDKYVKDLRAREGLATPGVGYTAYELRSATALVLLGRKAEAIELLSTLTKDQRPPEWNQWPEISWLRKTEPSFLGDLPHTWIGGSYVHALRSLLLLEREGARPGDGDSLLVGAGIPLDWLDAREALRASRLPTWFGAVSLSWQREDDDAGGRRRIRILLEDAAQASENAATALRSFVPPEGGIVVAAPFGAAVEGVTVDGVAATVENDAVRVRKLPATVLFQYKPPLE